MSSVTSATRVLMTSDAVGGVWSYTLDLARGLNGHGITVFVAVMGPAPSDDQREQAESAGIHPFERNCSLEWMDDPWHQVDAASEWLLDLERTLRPDVIHLNGYCHGALEWPAPVLMAGHSCVMSWWRAVHGVDAPECWDEYRRRVRQGLHAAALVVAPTRAMLDALNDHYGPFAGCRVIPNGYSYSASADLERLPVILSAGRIWDEAKNIQALCEIAHEVAWPVCIAGENRHREAGKRLPETVRYLGRLTAAVMRDWYAHAAIYALPARYEPFGLSVLEAAAMGCALVLGDIRSLRENWNGAAWFVPPDNRRALKFALDALIRDRALRADLASRARLRAAEFTVDRMVNAYVQAYGDLCPPQMISAAFSA